MTGIFLPDMTSAIPPDMKGDIREEDMTPHIREDSTIASF